LVKREQKESRSGAKQKPWGVGIEKHRSCIEERVGEVLTDSGETRGEANRNPGGPGDLGGKIQTANFGLVPRNRRKLIVFNGPGDVNKTTKGNRKKKGVKVGTFIMSHQLLWGKQEKMSL